MLDVNEFDSMRIGLASPEQILEWSHGEVKKPETINYRTLKPERDGLFCERIFGPTKDWECHCGKYKRIRHKGVVCDKCGVEVTRAKVRRERMGHIQLATPVSHIWYFKGIPSRMGLILDVSPRSLERVLYFASYIVVDPAGSPLAKRQLLSEQEYREYEAQFNEEGYTIGGKSVVIETVAQRNERLAIVREAQRKERYNAALREDATIPEADKEYEELTREERYELGATEEILFVCIDMGAEAVKALLSELDLEQLNAELREELNTASGQRKIRAVRRLEVVEAFRQSGNRPEWMIMDVVPVIPPELRPMVQLDGGRFATSDLNDLYRRVINRNNRLKRLLDLGAPDIIVRNEKRMLQEAVDALIDNGRRGRPVTGPGNRPLKSLSDMLKGKQGRFRQNLLGKRVDYSGRSVIVVGPELKMHQCGLPKEMALELFKPFVMKRLVERGQASNIKAAKRQVERVGPGVWESLEEVIKEHPVLLNRAPTLHRLGIQAFEPILWEGRAIKLHPLVCTAFNADFDGDQMACHLPLSVEAQSEARTLMLSVHNILSTKDGKPVAVPSQDMILGTYYLTVVREDTRDKAKTFATYDEVMLAYDSHVIGLQDILYIRLPEHGRVETTAGRLIFNNALFPELWQYEQKEDGTYTLGKVMDKKTVGKLVDQCFQLFGNEKTAELLDRIKSLGYSFARRAGMTVAIADIKVPEEKFDLLDTAEQEVEKVSRLYRRGLITEEERYRKTIQLWTKATEDVTDAMMDNMARDKDGFNPVYMMAISGARGNKQQIRQLAGMRGLMADPSGRIIDLPIKANFKEGLTVLDYFTSSHGARKGLADTALRTADSGYLTRRLVDVSQDVIVREDDCDVVGIDLVRERARLATSPRQALEMLKDKLIGRVLDKDVVNAETGELAVPAETILDEQSLADIADAGVTAISLRGAHLGSDSDINHTNLVQKILLGESDDSIRATLKETMVQNMLNKDTVNAIVDSNGVEIYPADTRLTEEGIEAILNSDVKEVQVRNNEINGIEVEAIVEGTGIIEPLKDRIVGRIAAEELVNKETGEVIVPLNGEITEELADEVVKHYDVVKIRSVLTCRSPYGVCRKCYGRDLGTGDQVQVGEAVGIIAAQSIGEPGTQLTMRTFHTGGVAGDDITQGLPRVEELFEARKPKRNAIIAENEGVVRVVPNEGKKGTNTIFITGEDGIELDYLIPYGSRIIVKDGDVVSLGARLTEGSINPHDIMRVMGTQATQRYLVYEVQKVYKSQGVEINDKHIEVIVRQMLHKVKIETAGDADMLPGDMIDINTFDEENRRLTLNGRENATGKRTLLGITKAALATDSFLSAASFQETTRVLTDAAIKGKIDPLLGLKENVIIGKLIPAGTGMSRYRKIEVVKKAPEILELTDDGEIIEE
ncbi:DNA-directed RNA polymerase subunit beta' [Veillonella atypica]|uniref:DNA-directed RNA polymerase subunit beta' n=2 Tax=Veillonella atypica TaxID=39777 RepID=UPI000E5528B8|nr:DNA-directed RNA polymerase subunit beta' [Veillonella atypica]MBD9034284.1 DNA-directed RNA polymerase subunit beta' [Veillonella atypica]RHL88792.1 DNA-directed RNA polymerase subunit beta' [Veillonella atypica]VTY43820.1 DNA-directed RNA polymerase subunit beta' [Veillonella atypica]